MSNDTTAAGWLTPTGSPPAWESALNQTLAQWIAGVSGLPGTAITPLWQDNATTPDMPGCAFGITEIHAAPPYWAPLNADDDLLTVSEQLQVQCLFTGTDAPAFATQFRDGMAVAQNQDELNRMGLAVCASTAIICVSELIDNQWQRRYRMTVSLSRIYTRTYHIKSLATAQVAFTGE
ncbi:phage neck terminator protein [Cronobacter sakazakii]|uniref:phage neck terminator protein n=1 Tax=Cronobacter sakazakii TaxID=28141 RepID=UPI000BE8F649|nr:hypothetical protein [Cronobacter sakazakii]ELQ5981312.1 hypothetical protein [Cronobacter sakazakii]ELY3745716.1 hypothetical protein [Cronobacter sakazakii]PUV45235.1 hypothetical protein CDU02_03860 [Cronobacter sakazakii]TWR38409.1 hypothetical protein FQY86_12060 [Cronobacter sakazakii]